MKKKVLFMISYMNIGGVEKSLLSLLSRMSPQEYDVTILMLEKKGGFLKLLPEWVKVVEASWYPELKEYILESPYKMVRGFIKEKKIFSCILYTFSYLISKYFNNRYLFYQVVMRSVPIFPSVFDVAISYQGPTEINDYYIGEKVRAKKKISWVHFDVKNHKINSKLYRELYKKYTKIKVVSKQAMSNLIQIVPSIKNKVEVARNIVDEKNINTLALTPVNFDDGYKGKRIITVGRLSKEKGQDLAIRALLRLKREGYDVKWYCVGDGNDRLYYESLINQLGLKEDFILLGAKENPYPYINKSDVYVQTSRHEGFCITLAEAKCLNKPIITTNFIGAYEQIKDGITGFIIDCTDDEIYSKVKLLINNDNICETLTTNLRNEVGKEHLKTEIV